MSTEVEERLERLGDVIGGKLGERVVALASRGGERFNVTYGHGNSWGDSLRAASADGVWVDFVVPSVTDGIELVVHLDLRKRSRWSMAVWVFIMPTGTERWKPWRHGFGAYGGVQIRPGDVEVLVDDGFPPFQTEVVRRSVDKLVDRGGDKLASATEAVEKAIEAQRQAAEQLAMWRRLQERVA